MAEHDVRTILKAVASDEMSLEEAERKIASTHFSKLGHLAELDLEREKRAGFPEVVFGASKTAEHIAQIVAALVEHSGKAFVTKLDPEKASAVMTSNPHAELKYNPVSQTLRTLKCITPKSATLKAAVVSGGTSDLPVVQEAEDTLAFCGWDVECFNDVGVAGLERLLKICPKLDRADVIVAVAGMEGALPTVLAGLIATPIIAVPTSVGYGVSSDGMAALHGMLASCAPGLSVVNIDNGFGAAVAAHRILLGKCHKEELTNHGR